jgi:hypothetical protein
VNKAKRKNVVKHAPLVKESELLKMKAKKKQQSQSSEVAPVKEEKKEEEEPVKRAPDVKEQEVIKVLELTPNEERDVKLKIYFKVYEEFLTIYQGNSDKQKKLCSLLNIPLNLEDPNESLKAIFKIAKAKLRSLIDFDGDLPIREKLNIEELKLESPF